MDKDKKELESIIQSRSAKELSFYSSLFFELKNYRDGSLARVELAMASIAFESVKNHYGVNSLLIEL